MSGVFKGIGKIFKGVVKVVKKVAIPALMIGAVVLTGGAAIGALPSLGTMLGGLGLSAGVSSALAGAISSGAVGAVVGGLTGGWKGAKKGFLGGAITGGVMGAAGMMGPNGLIGGGKAASGGLLAPGSELSTSINALTDPVTAAASGASGATSAVAGSTGIGAAAPAIGATASAPAATAAAAGGGGLFGGNALLTSQLLGGVANAFAPNEYKQRSRAEQEEFERAGYFAYGGGDTNGGKKGGLVQGVYSGQENPFGIGEWGEPPTFAAPGYSPPAKRWVFDPATNSVVEVPVGVPVGGA